MMSLRKTTIVDNITIDDIGCVSIRTRTTVYEDDSVISTTYHRAAFDPGSDISDYSQYVQNICAAAWTPDIIAAFKDKFEG